jgi:hypothetical protein
MVAVERRHNAIAVTPGVAVGDVFIEPVGVGIASDVEPVSAPAFTVGRRGQQAIDHALERLR